MREVNNKLGRTVVAGETLMYKKGSTGKSSAVPNQMVRRWRRVMLLPDGSSWPVVLLVPLLYVTTQWSMLDVLERRSRPSVRKRSASKAKRKRRARSRSMFGEHSVGYHRPLRPGLALALPCSLPCRQFPNEAVPA